jgi:hypothetical protein
MGTRRKSREIKLFAGKARPFGTDETVTFKRKNLRYCHVGYNGSACVESLDGRIYYVDAEEWDETPLHEMLPFVI